MQILALYKGRVPLRNLSPLLFPLIKLPPRIAEISRTPFGHNVKIRTPCFHLSCRYTSIGRSKCSVFPSNRLAASYVTICACVPRPITVGSNIEILSRFRLLFHDFSRGFIGKRIRSPILIAFIASFTAAVNSLLIISTSSSIISAASNPV